MILSCSTSLFSYRIRGLIVVQEPQNNPIGLIRATEGHAMFESGTHSKGSPTLLPGILTLQLDIGQHNSL
jgi:hypothetical protein